MNDDGSGVNDVIVVLGSIGLVVQAIAVAASVFWARKTVSEVAGGTATGSRTLRARAPNG